MYVVAIIKTEQSALKKYLITLNTINCSNENIARHNTFFTIFKNPLPVRGDVETV